MTGHGGDIYDFMKERDIEQKSVVDFSASINPLGTPENVLLSIKKHLKDIINYPDTGAAKLTDKIAETLNINPKSIICGNGSTELIYLVPRAMRFQKILIPQPTFSDYERACRIACPECIVTDHMLEHKNSFDLEPGKFIDQTLSIKPDGVFICNPNNPTGRLIEKKTIIRIAEVMRKQKIYTIIDESFIDFCSGGSVTNEVENNPYLVVLKSMTKFYALAGLRLGYGIFPLHIAKVLRECREPWSVNTLAQAAGIAALDENAYREKTMKVLHKQKIILEKGLKGLGIDYIPSQANYYLLHTPRAKKLAKRLTQRGIMVRDCSNFKGLDHRYLRIAVKSQKQNILFLKHMEECIE